MICEWSIKLESDIPYFNFTSLICQYMTEAKLFNFSESHWPHLKITVVKIEWKKNSPITYHAVSTVSGPRPLWIYLWWHCRAGDGVRGGLRRENGPESKKGDADLNVIQSLYNKQYFLTAEEAAWESITPIGGRITQRLSGQLTDTPHIEFLHQ